MRARSKPRGFYTDQSHFKWSRDYSKNYIEGNANLFFWPTVKMKIFMSVFAAVYFATDRLMASFIVCVGITMYYQHAVALCFDNTKVVPTLDQGMYASNENAIVNFAVMNFYDRDELESMKEKFASTVRMFKKFRYKVKFIYGDPYYEEMGVEEAVQKAFVDPPTPDKVLRSQEDIDMYIEDNLNVKMPNDGPLIRFYFQSYEPTDQDHVPPEKRAKLFGFVKLHHSLCDGLSSICTPLAASDEFDRSYFARTPDATFMQRALIRLMMPFQIIPFLWMAFAKTDRNAITVKRDLRGLSGKINITSSPPLDLEAIKRMAKIRGATINDAILSSFVTALHSTFKDIGEEIPKSIQVAVPASVRFKFYESREKVRFQNKITGLVVEAPLTPTLDMKAVKAITNKIKGSIGMIYAGYAFTRQVIKLSPRLIQKHSCATLTRKTTAFFSNVPGCIKPMRYTNPQTGDVTSNTVAYPYMQPTGEVGFSLAAVSWLGSYYMSLNSDESVLTREQNQKLMATMVRLIQDEIAATKMEENNEKPTAIGCSGTTQAHSGSDAKSQDSKQETKKSQ